MRILQIVILAFSLFVFESCTTQKVGGRYTNVYFGIAGEELRFFQKPDSFKYYSKSEGSISAYSSGRWIQKKRSVFLNGYEQNVNVLYVDRRIENYSEDSSDKIVIQYNANQLDTFIIKVDVVINDSFNVRLTGDRTAFSNSVISTIQLKSYLVLKGLLQRVPSLIDTLYSEKIKVADVPKTHKSVLLQFELAYSDFFRTKLIDTLNIVNNRTLIWHNRKFKKLRE